MPIRTDDWTEAEVALEHGGVTVFHVYKNDRLEAKLAYWFALSPERKADPFDVRELAVPAGRTLRASGIGEQEEVLSALRQAIDAGILVSPPQPGARL